LRDFLGEGSDQTEALPVVGVGLTQDVIRRYLTYPGPLTAMVRYAICKALHYLKEPSRMTDTLNETAPASPAPTTETTPPFLKVSDAAVAKIREIMDQEGLGEGQGLRVRVVGGGCHGFSYSLNFDAAAETDHVMPIGAVPFIVDKFSAPYLMGAEIDYVDTLQGAGFKITNPHAKSTCGCGSSFSA
jgi:iron-sulfur cluster insertion protein